MTMKIVPAALAAVVVSGMADVHAATTDLKPEELTRAVKAFLVDHGDLCLAMYDWPRDVTPQDQQENSHEAVQLPVLEHLGVVRSEEVEGATRRYSLSTKGQEYFLRKSRVTLDVHTQPEIHPADFCVAHLTLDKVVKWSSPEPVHDHLQTVVKYTYHVKAADFMDDPEAQRVFPIVDRVIRGAGSQIMTATVQLKDGLWVPVLPGQ
jgi:hypothetical protein